jgi:hypothetical protein
MAIGSIAAAVRRCERHGLHLEGGDATTILDRLDSHFARAQRRRERDG